MEMNVSDDPVKGFLGRWSRLKREAAAAEAPPPVDVPAAIVPQQAPDAGQVVPDTDVPAEPPPLESLGFDSDYRAFLGQKVDEGLKRAALKKLFHTPHFNTMDGLDVYIEDFNLYEPLPASMVSQLAHAKETLNPTLPDDWLTSVPEEVPPALAEAADVSSGQPAVAALEHPEDDGEGVAAESNEAGEALTDAPAAPFDHAGSNPRSE